MWNLTSISCHQGEVLGPFWAEDVASWIAYDQLLRNICEAGRRRSVGADFRRGSDDASGESSAEEENNDTCGGKTTRRITSMEFRSAINNQMPQ